jgi:hypothetical protein
MEEYISHVDYKKMMENFKKGTPKKMLKEGLEKEGNAFTAGLAKAKKGQEFKIGDKEVKDTSNYDASMEEASYTDNYEGSWGYREGKVKESHEGNDQWYDTFSDTLAQLNISDKARKLVDRALNHADVTTTYSDMTPQDAAKEFVKDIVATFKNQVKEGGTEGESFDFNKSAIESATGDKISHTEEDDYGMPVYWGTKNPNVTYQINDDDQIIKYNSETGERFPIGDLKSYDEPAQDYEPDTDADYEEPRDDFDMSGGDFNDGEFWENEVKKLQEIAGVGPQDDGPEDDNDEERKKRADKEEEEDTEAENAERDAVDEEAHADGSHMRDPDTAAKTVAEKHGAELKPLYDKYQAAYEQYIKDINNKELSKAYSALVKEFQNNAINWCGHEMLEAGMKRVQVNNLLSGYGYFEDWLSDYITAIGKELGGASEKEKAMYANTDPNIADPINEGSDYNKIIPALKAKGVKYGMPEKEIIKAMAEVMKQEAGYTDKEIRYYLGYEEDFIPDLLQALKDSDMEEGLNMPPLQATGQTIVTNEDQAPYGFEVLSPDERKQLKEFIDSYKTIKAEISKLLEKAGKSGRIMEGTREEDEEVPAERRARYNEPTKTPKHKSSNLGGNRTGLVMTKAEMWEGEESGTIADSLGEKLHSTFSKVTDMAIKQLVADGWDEDQAISFLQAEIEEKGKEATMSQYDM